MSAQYDSMVKRFHAGRAAQSGVYGASLARNGYTGISSLFEASYGGYGTTLSPTFDLETITAGLGSTWETESVGFKPYSTNGSCHPTIDALLGLRARHGIDSANVVAVRLRVSSATKEHVGWAYQPVSVTTAQMNLPYIVAVVLADGEAFVRQFTADRIHDPALVEFSRRVEVVSDSTIDLEGDAGRHHTLIEVELVDGTVLTDERHFAKGSVREPMSVEDVRDKFDKLVQGILSKQHADRLAEVVATMQDQPDLHELIALLTTEPPH